MSSTLDSIRAALNANRVRDNHPLSITRRSWFQIAGGLVIAGAGGVGWHQARQTTIRIGLIGAGERAHQLASSIVFTRWFDVKGQIVTVCDVDRTRAEQLRSQFARGADVTQDFHEVLGRDNISAVFIATPDHWHVPLSIAALQAGKHVYCEKPMTLTIAEGQQLKKAVAASNRTFLVGTQQRSDPKFQLACELVRNGRLGQLQQIKISVPPNAHGGPFSAQSAPQSLNWERWLGPAPDVAYCSERFLHFRPWYEYSGGSMTDWGAHHLDIAHWAMGIEESGPSEISAEASLPKIENGYNAPPAFNVAMTYPNGVTVHVETSPKENGLLFEGDEGRISVNRHRLTGKPVEDLSSNPLPCHGVKLGHHQNYWTCRDVTHIRHFFNCILTGEKPISDVVSQHRSISACHLANIAMRLQRPVKWDAKLETFPNDAEAAAMLSRVSRPV